MIDSEGLAELKLVPLWLRFKPQFSTPLLVLLTSTFPVLARMMVDGVTCTSTLAVLLIWTRAVYVFVASA